MNNYLNHYSQLGYNHYGYSANQIYYNFQKSFTIIDQYLKLELQAKYNNWIIYF